MMDSFNKSPKATLFLWTQQETSCNQVCRRRRRRHRHFGKMVNFRPSAPFSGLVCSMLLLGWSCSRMDERSLLERYYVNRESTKNPFFEEIPSTRQSSPTNRTQQQEEPPTTIAIVETVGELGNHLQLLNAGLELQEWLSLPLLDEKETRTSVKLMIHQSMGQLHKSQMAYKTIQRCFPMLAETFGYIESSREIPWEEGNKNTSDVAVVTFLKRESTFRRNNNNNNNNNNNTAKGDINVTFLQRGPRNDTVTTTTSDIDNSLSSPSAAQERHPSTSYYIPLNNNPRRLPSPERMHKYFQFDTKKCCPPILPDPNVTVLHIRGFSSELSEATAKERGLYDLDPHRTATQLLGHLQPGSVVWLISRFEEDMYPFEKAFLVDNVNKSIHVSRIVSSDSMHDFCILQQATNVAGISRSTFLTWALRLNTNLRRADLYSIVPKNGGGTKKKKKYPCREFTNDERVICHEFTTLD